MTNITILFFSIYSLRSIPLLDIQSNLVKISLFIKSI